MAFSSSLRSLSSLAVVTVFLAGFAVLPLSLAFFFAASFFSFSSFPSSSSSPLVTTFFFANFELFPLSPLSFGSALSLGESFFLEGPDDAFVTDLEGLVGLADLLVEASFGDLGLTSFEDDLDLGLVSISVSVSRWAWEIVFYGRREVVLKGITGRTSFRGKRDSR